VTLGNFRVMLPEERSLIVGLEYTSTRDGICLLPCGRVSFLFAKIILVLAGMCQEVEI